jgi:hypothetical protein
MANINLNFLKIISMNRIKIFIAIIIAQTFFSLHASAQKQFKALLIPTTNGWHHESVHAGVLAIQQLGIKIILMLYISMTLIHLLIRTLHSSR